MSIRSGKTERAVSGSAAIGGGSTAADGTTLTAAAVASIKNAVPTMSVARLHALRPLIIDLLLSGWDSCPPPVSSRLAQRARALRLPFGRQVVRVSDACLKRPLTGAHLVPLFVARHEP